MLVTHLIVTLIFASQAIAKQAAVCRGLFLGVDTSDPEAKGEDIYRDEFNFPTAAASILTFFGNLTNISPHSQTPTELVEALLELPADPVIEGFRGFRLSHRLVELEGGLENFEQAVQRVYDPYNDGTIAKTMRELILTLENDEDKGDDDEMTEWTLCIVIIRKETFDKPTYVKLVRAPIRLTKDKDGRVVAPQQMFFLLASDYKPSADVLQRYAGEFASRVPTTTVHGFKKHFTSKPATASGNTVDDKWQWWKEGQRQSQLGHA